MRAEAAEVGDHLLASSWAIYNELATTRPDIIRLLATPNWYFDPYVSRIFFCSSNQPLANSVLLNPSPLILPILPEDRKLTQTAVASTTTLAHAPSSSMKERPSRAPETQNHHQLHSIPPDRPARRAKASCKPRLHAPADRSTGRHRGPVAQTLAETRRAARRHGIRQQLVDATLAHRLSRRRRACAVPCAHLA